MVAGAILKCIMLAKFQVDVVETSINEYAMATMNKTHNGVQFEATVIEGRMNSLSIQIPEMAKTMTYSNEYNQRTLATRLEVKDDYATIDCEIL